MEHFLVLSALGADRTGMVHELTRLVSECGGNLAESRMSALGSEFAMLLLVVSVLTSLASTMQKGFATMDKGFAAVADDIADIKRDMATKDQIIALHTQVNAIERELRDIKLSLTRVVYREDMDQALARIAAIEKHLGLNKKIAA